MNIVTKAVEWVQQKTVLSLSNAANWYQRNGYSKLAAGHAGDRDGRYISDKTALHSTAVFGCIKIISEDVGSLPLHVYKRNRERTDAAKDYDNPLYRLLHDQANPETTAIEFREAITAHALLMGNGYARVDRSSSDSGRVIALWQMMPYHVQMDRDSNNTLYYVYKDGNSPEKTYDASDIFHLRGFSFDGVSGCKITEIARQTIGLALDQMDYADRFFRSDATPGVVLEHPGKIGGPQQLADVRKAWTDAVSSHGVAVTQEGMKVNRFATTNTEAQLIEQRRFQILEVCRLFRMQPHKLAELGDATYNNIEHQQREYYTNTLRPWLVRWEQAIKRCLLQGQNDIYAEHSIEGLLRGDFKTQSEGFARMLDKGVMSPNEVRALMNLGPYEGGDIRLVPLNMQDVASAARGMVEEEEPDPAPRRVTRVRA